MSPICQTFVQNAWRKDLCSNCFKSEEEHGSSRKNEFHDDSRDNYQTDNSGLGRRYLGFAGRTGLYPRNYYGSKSWNPLMLDNSNNDSRLLKSPGLIKGMDSIIKQENEKNRNLINQKDELENQVVEEVINRANLPKDSWITQIIGDSKMKGTEQSHRLQGDSSSDLGSDSSHETSVSSGNTSGCSDGEVKADSDASSVRSEQDSAHEEEPPVQGILKAPRSSVSSRHTVKASISFNENHEVIGYGGDVDYSDDEDDYDEEDDDDDDDDSSISSLELSPEERCLKRLTEKNTNFNSENENLEKDPIVNGDTLESRDFSYPSNEPLDSPNKSKTEKSDEVNGKQEVKVKLKRSQPILGVKPNIKPNFTSTGNSGSANSLDTPVGSHVNENVPMKGIKPKFVSREDEMRENTEYDDMYQRNHRITSVDSISPKVTSIDDILCSKVTSIDDILCSKVTSIDDISPNVTTVDDVAVKVTSIDDIFPKVTGTHDTAKVTLIDDVVKRTLVGDTAKISSIDDIVKKTSIDDTAKVTSIDDIIVKRTSTDDTMAKVTAVDDISTIDTSCSASVSDVSRRVSNPSVIIPHKVTEILPEGNTSHSSVVSKPNSKDDCFKITYVDDISTYEYEPTKLYVNKKSSNTATQRESEASLSNSSDHSNLSNNKEGRESVEIDHSVRSAQTQYSLDKSNNLKPSTIGEEGERFSSNESKLEKVTSGVIPLNMITIQRRSSFMESQLGGTVFSIDTPMDVPSEGNKIEVTKDSPKVTSLAKKTHKPTAVLEEKTTTDVEAVQVKGKDHKILPLINKPDVVKAYTKENKKDKEDNEKSVILEDKTLQYNKDDSTKHLSSNETQNKDNNMEIVTNQPQNSKNFEPLKKKENNSIIKTSDFLPQLETGTTEPKNINNKSYSEENNSVNKVSDKPMSTFKTPVGAGSPPNSSFLHSGAVRPVTEPKEINSIISSTPEFLRGIKTQSNPPAVTASIQKSALHSSSSTLKGVSLGKPATTPKPNYLKDKPKVPIKPFMSSSKIYSRELSSDKKLEVRVTNSSITKTCSAKQADDICNNNNSKQDCNVVNPATRKSSLTEEIAILQQPITNKDIVYDVPVAVGHIGSATTLSAPSPSSSSGYSSSTNVSQNCDNPITNLNLEDIKSDDNGTNDKNEPPATRTLKDETDSGKGTFECKDKKYDDTSNGQTKTDDRPFSVAQETNENTIQNLRTDEKEIFPRMKETQNIEMESEGPTFHREFIAPPSYVNLLPAYDNHDVDSYSSFTDDFDDDDEDDEDDDDDMKTNKSHFINIDNRSKIQPLRRTERSSSATPLFRNSVGPINFNPINVCDAGVEKLPAVRSQSVPRTADHVIDPSVFAKIKTESNSKFGFKSGFFRPNSPPSVKRKAASERGRDRTKKSLSVFSLRKLLRFGSGEKSVKATKEAKSPKEQEVHFQRETRKMKLQIIHPLDYNTTGVEVISRPEKRSPTYDFTGINDPLIQEALRQHAIEMEKRKSEAPPSSQVQITDPISSQDVQIGNKIQDITRGKTSSGKVAKKNSFLKRRRKPERNDSEKSDSNSVSSYVRQSENSQTKKEPESNTINLKSSNNPSVTNKTSVLHTTTSLGFNSEGRPRPPPPPRKTSLDINAQMEGYKTSMNPPKRTSFDSTYSSNRSSTSSKAEGDTSSVSSTCSSTRPHRPPPPRRTPSNSGTSYAVGVPRSKDSLYANLGNARASFTPRKPGRTSSMKDEDREKRRAPNPPVPPQQHSQHQREHTLQTKVSTTLKDELNEALQSFCDRPRSTKGPAPLIPLTSEYDLGRGHDYEHVTNSSDECSELSDRSDLAVYDLPRPLPPRNVQEENPPYFISELANYSARQKEKGQVESLCSSSSSINEKTSRQKGRRGSVVTNLSLEDQYGAVIFANLEALSNMLDQMCNHTECGGYERVMQTVVKCSQISLRSRDPISCGLRLFYLASAASCDITLMVTPETKVEIDPLLIPNPILTLKDDISSTFLPNRKMMENSFSSGTVWILPEMTICSLEEFSHLWQRLLQDRPSEWERRICLFLLQVVSALKQLQAKGTEEISLNSILVITNIYGEDSPRLLMASCDGNSGSTLKESADNNVSLCHCAAAVTQLLLGHTQPLEGALTGPILSPPLVPSPHAFSALVTALREERSSSLTKAKCILEMMLFGPEDLKGISQADGDVALQKWLDLERANILHSLVREQAAGEFNRNCLVTKFHLLFLVRTNVKALKEAVRALEAPFVTNF